MRYLKTCVSAALITAALCVSAFAATIGGATVNASALNLRAEPSTDSAVSTVVPRGGAVAVIEKLDGDWYKVNYRGTEGYMSAEFLSFSETLNASLGTGYIQGSSVRMRSSPSLTSEILGHYNSGTQMTVTGISGNWYAVSYNGQSGYVSSDFFSIGSSASAPASSGSAASESSDIGQKIVEAANQYMGVPYVWAGTSPSGFDCSGFVYYVFKECGYSTSRTAASIYDNGVYVERSALQPGDAICFSNSSYSYIGHVGIYIGDDQFIHASSGAGSVIVSSIASGYYNDHYYGARRII